MPPAMSETFPQPNGSNHGAAGRRPTMREVAAVAGVSLSTVSRTLNDDPKVDPALAEKVRTAVAMLGYRRDATATNLRRVDLLSASIGLVFDDVANPFQQNPPEIFTATLEQAASPAIAVRHSRAALVEGSPAWLSTIVVSG